MTLTDLKYMSSIKPEGSKLGHGNQRPETNISRAFMPLLITSNFNDDAIKIERANIEIPFSHYKSMGIL